MAETVRTTTSIDEVLRRAVERGVVPGVVAMAANDEGPLYEGGAGVREAGADDPITPDTMLRIASMTKMVTTVAALRLYEQGKLGLDAPVETYRPSSPSCRCSRAHRPARPCRQAVAGQSLADEVEEHITGRSG
jgi:methyl acetate hydrolase